MATYLILAQSSEAAAALKTRFAVLPPANFTGDEPLTLIWPSPADDPLVTIDKYHSFADAIQAEMTANPGVPVAMMDAVDPSLLSATRDGGWECLVAMLILTFPEIRWMVGMLLGPAQDRRRLSDSTLLSSSTLDDRVSALFDASGLRNWVRSQTNLHLAHFSDNFQLPVRFEKAAIIEDEAAFAYFHGYIAYRFGCSAELVTTWTRMRALFGASKGPHGFWLLIEDMSLDFPDRERGVEVRQFKGPGQSRSSHCPRLDSTNPALEDSAYRVLVTSGHSRSTDSVLAQNEAHLDSKSKGIGRVVYKPTGGMFALWERAGVLQSSYATTANSTRQKGNAPSFEWPPGGEPAGEQDPSHHGAPGKLELIAERLIERARAWLNQTASVVGTITAATLATDALETTGGSAPTLALEALSLKHQFEAIAECQFSGVEYHIGAEQRLSEIRRDVEAICKRFGEDQRRDAALNAEMKILVILVRIFREYGQFDEEQTCMVRARYIQNTLWLRGKKVRWICWPVVRYLELLMKSVSLFAMILLAWVVGLALLFWWTTFDGTSVCAFYDSVTSIFSIGPPLRPNQYCTKQSEILPIIVTIAVVTGAFHLGVFISHLYAFLSRR